MLTRVCSALLRAHPRAVVRPPTTMPATASAARQLPQPRQPHPQSRLNTPVYPPFVAPVASQEMLARLQAVARPLMPTLVTAYARPLCPPRSPPRPTCRSRRLRLRLCVGPSAFRLRRQEQQAFGRIRGCILLPSFGLVAYHMRRVMFGK